MAPASPAPKRPKQRDQVIAPAAAQDVSLAQVITTVADLHARFARDEVYVTGIYNAVDHNAVILEEMMARLIAVEQKATEVSEATTKLGTDAKENDERLDLQLRAELNAVTSRLGDELRAENIKMAQAYEVLKGVALGAAAAAKTAQTKPSDPPGFASLTTVEMNVAQLDARVTAAVTQHAQFDARVTTAATQLDARVTTADTQLASDKNVNCILEYS